MTNAVAKPQSRVATVTLRTHLESSGFREQIAKVLPKHLTPDRFVRIALTALTRTPKLAECDQYSFFNCLLNLSQFGLEPDGRRAHLIPFENRKRNCVECQLIIDYKGLAELVMRSGQVTKLHADKVCEGDRFEYDCGEVKKHQINIGKPRGKTLAYYAMAIYQGIQKAELMLVEDVEVIRKRSRAGNNGPWITDFDEMAKKTVFRRLSKWLPLSSEIRDAVDGDDDTVIDVQAHPARSLVDSTPFEIPPPPEPTGDPDESAEAEAGLAPQGEKRPIGTVQDQLAGIVTDGGFTFEEWRAWALDEKIVTDKELPAFDLVPDKVATRLVTAKAGMLAALAKRKAGV